MEKLVKDHHYRMLRPPCARSHSRHRGAPERFEELDRGGGLLHSAFGVYETRHDRFSIKVFI